jgi:hypothetical protein
MRQLLTFLISAVIMSAASGRAQDNTNPYVAVGDKCLMTQDGPAAPVEKCLFTPAATKTSNPVKVVGPTDSLPMALSAAIPGDEIDVDPANVTNIAGKLALPDGICAPGKWIVVRTSSNVIPGEHVRITPAYEKYVPKIVLTAQNASVVGGQCLRLIGLEITRPTGSGVLYNMYIPGSGSHDVIIDRVLFRGTPMDETNRGLMLSNAQRITVMNSWFDGFHCRALTGLCGDSQAIAGGTSTTNQDGPFKIVNNHLEAAGENVSFGGGPANYVVSDIVIAYNDLVKLKSWNPSDPTYDGGSAGKDKIKHPWIVKNHFELKNGDRVLFEGNRFENTWGGFTQVGAMLLLTPKNQANVSGQSVCPLCQVTNITIRYNWGSYGAQAIQAGCGANAFGGWPTACGNDSIHDNLFDHLQYPSCYLCGSFLNLLGGGSPSVPFHDVTISHNTFKNDGWLTPAVDKAATGADGVLTASTPPAGSVNFHFDNNIFDPGNYGIYSSGGGAGNCWSSSGSLAARVALCWPGGSFTGNQFTPTVPFVGKLPWPTGNGTNPNAGANMALVNAAIANRH